MATAAASGEGFRILVIEDEDMMARLITRALGAVGFDVTTASNGLSGLKLVRSGAFALVILDLLLPDVDGLSVLGAMTDHNPKQRVLVLSALSDVHSKVRCLEFGACDYVTKPFDLPELIARVRLRVRERRSAENERFRRSGNYTLDLQRRIVLVGNAATPLSTREFALLEYLMRREGEGCTREELLEHVWGCSFDPATNVVDVCVARLRAKLGGDCVQTVRNVGYSFLGA